MRDSTPHPHLAVLCGAILTVLSACSHGRRVPLPAATTPTHYQVATVGAIGKRYVTESYVLKTKRISKFTFETISLQSQGSWEAAGLSSAYDSRHPKSSDPWPVSLQQAIGTVRTRVEVDETFRPQQLADIPRWRNEASQNILGLGLPDVAQKSVDAMLDPDSVTRNLARDFPGLPKTGAPWTRTATISGISFQLEQTCSKKAERALTRWTCTGNTPAAGGQRGRLLDLNTTTEIEVDKYGLLRHTMTYDGVIVRADTTGSLSHHAIAGKRAVTRFPTTEATPAPGAPEDNRPNAPQ